MSKFPPLQWYQRKDAVLITVNVLDSTDVSVGIEAIGTTSVLKLSLASGSGDKQRYAADITLFAAVEPALSKHQVRARGVLALSLAKKPTSADPDDWFWPRLALEKTKNASIKPDLDKWKDADELDAVGRAGGLAGDDDFGFADSDVGGMSLEHEEVQRTLAALRAEQQQVRAELALARGESDETPDQRRLRIAAAGAEIDKEHEALRNSGAAAAVAAASNGGKQGGGDDDGDDDMPDLVG